MTPKTGRTKDKRPPTHLSQAAKGHQLQQEGGGQTALGNSQGTECPLPLPTHPPIPPLSSYLHCQLPTAKPAAQSWWSSQGTAGPLPPGRTWAAHFRVFPSGEARPPQGASPHESSTSDTNAGLILLWHWLAHGPWGRSFCPHLLSLAGRRGFQTAEGAQRNCTPTSFHQHFLPGLAHTCCYP